MLKRRKHRRKIVRRKRDKKLQKRRKFLYTRHMNAPITNRWTRVTTYLLIIFEFVFVIWWLQDLLLNWDEIVAKLSIIWQNIMEVF